MMLYINGQDIARLTLGLFDDRWVVGPETFAVPPEQTLATIDAFLRDKTVSREVVSGLAVVRGPGSATSLRTAISLANAWAFARQLPILGIEKTREEDDAAMTDRIRAAHPVPMTTPIYEAGAKITPSAKDVLGRKNV